MRKESFQGILLGIVIMCAVFAFITVAWAALSSTLNISGQATVAKSSWDVGFSHNTSPFTGTPTVSCNAGATSATCGSPVSLTKTTFGGASVNLGTLNSIGDTLTYSWYIVNNGDFDATVSAISGAETSSCTSESESCKIALTCNWHADDSSYSFKDAYCQGFSATLKFGENAAKQGTIINKKSASPTAQAVSLIISFDGIGSSVTTLPSQAVTLSLASDISVGFGQA